MKEKRGRRSFLKSLAIGGVGASALPGGLLSDADKAFKESQAGSSFPSENSGNAEKKRLYNQAYTGEHLRKIAFPIGGIGAGMFCLEGTGAISHMSVRHRPEIYHEPN